MADELVIRRYKSIRELRMETRRVNVFIGEPNCGKTNILEAVALASPAALARYRESLRVLQPAQLFWNLESSDPIQVEHGGYHIQAKFRGTELVVSDDGVDLAALGSEGAASVHEAGEPDWALPVRYYLFNPWLSDASGDHRALSSPYGSNLSDILLGNKHLRDEARELFEPSGLRLTIDALSKQLTVTRDLDGTLLALPYGAASETVRRMLFYYSALSTNPSSILLFDEPEAHAFPPFAKNFAEQIALYHTGSRFFLTTHSPYLLTSVIEKTPRAELNVVHCRLEDSETRITPLGDAGLDLLLEWDVDAFYNLGRLIDE